MITSAGWPRGGSVRCYKRWCSSSRQDGPGYLCWCKPCCWEALLSFIFGFCYKDDHTNTQQDSLRWIGRGRLLSSAYCRKEELSVSSGTCSYILLPPSTERANLGRNAGLKNWPIRSCKTTSRRHEPQGKKWTGWIHCRIMYLLCVRVLRSHGIK